MKKPNPQTKIRIPVAIKGRGSGYQNGRELPDGVIEFYRERLFRRGDQDQSLRHGWRSRDMQNVRFAQIIKSLEEYATKTGADLSALSVFDFGCGTGDLFVHLHRANIGNRYIGVDGLAENIADAKKIFRGFPKPVELYQLLWDGESELPFKGGADIIVESGVFATIPKTNRDMIFPALLDQAGMVFAGTFYRLPMGAKAHPLERVLSTEPAELITLTDPTQFVHGVAVGYARDDFTYIVIRKEPRAIKHKPGGVDHDQSTHGNWADGSSSTEDSEYGAGTAPPDFRFEGYADDRLGKPLDDTTDDNIRDSVTELLLEKGFGETTGLLAADEWPLSIANQQAQIEDFETLGLEAASDTIRGIVKSDVVNSLEDEIQFPYTATEYEINRTIRQWADTANDADPASMVMQEAASVELGVPLSEWQKERSSEDLIKAGAYARDFQDKWNDYRYKEMGESPRPKFTNPEHEKWLEGHKIILAQEPGIPDIFDEDQSWDEYNEWEKKKAASYESRPITFFDNPDYVEQRAAWNKKLDEFQRPFKEKFEKRWPNLDWKLMRGRGESPPHIPDPEDRRRLIRAMYDQTQKWFSEKGYKPDDKVLLYRGIGANGVRNATGGQVTPSPGERAEYNGNAIESWSLQYHTAELFMRTTSANEGGASVVAMEVPVKNIVSTCLTGYGCLTESEFVILGSVPGQDVLIFAVKDENGDIVDIFTKPFLKYGEETKHKPGGVDHDQKTHGNWARSVGTGQTPGHAPENDDWLMKPNFEGSDFLSSRAKEQVDRYKYRQPPSVDRDRIDDEEYGLFITGWSGATDSERGFVKRAIADQLVERIEESRAGFRPISAGDINETLKKWSHTSNDADPAAISLQNTAAEVFGVPLSEWQKDKTPESAVAARQQYTDWVTQLNNDPEGVRHHPSFAEQFKEKWPQYDAMSINFALETQQAAIDTRILSTKQERAFLRAMYAETQEAFDAEGFGKGETIKLFRGVQLDGDHGYVAGAEIEYEGNVMESWSVEFDQATVFGNVVIAMEVPRENIVATATTGLGCLTEGEMVILGSVPNQTVLVVQSDNFEPIQEPEFTDHEMLTGYTSTGEIIDDTSWNAGTVSYVTEQLAKYGSLEIPSAQWVMNNSKQNGLSLIAFTTDTYPDEAVTLIEGGGGGYDIQLAFGDEIPGIESGEASKFAEWLIVHQDEGPPLYIGVSSPEFYRDPTDLDNFENGSGTIIWITLDTGDVIPIDAEEWSWPWEMQQAWDDAEMFSETKHLPGQHDQKTHGRKKKFGTQKYYQPMYRKEAKRVWHGKQVSGERGLTKLETGKIGEEIAMFALKDAIGAEFSELNVGLNNSPIDVAGDHHAVEVKAGHITNGRTAQHWRATIGQPGKAERAKIKQMSKTEKRAHNKAKQALILDRKAGLLAKMSEKAGAQITPATVGVLFNADATEADVYFVPGFHLRLPWKHYATEDYYLGTYPISAIKAVAITIPVYIIKHTPGGVDHDQSTHGNWADNKGSVTIRYSARKHGMEDRIIRLLESHSKPGVNPLKEIKKAYAVPGYDVELMLDIDSRYGDEFLVVIGSITKETKDSWGETHPRRVGEFFDEIVWSDSHDSSGVKNYIHATGMYLHSDYQDKDLSRSLAYGKARLAQKLGLDGIEFEANATIGRYAWATYLGVTYRKKSKVLEATVKFRAWAAYNKLTEPSEGWPEFGSVREVALYRHPDGEKFKPPSNSRDRAKWNYEAVGDEFNLGKAFMLDMTEWGHGNWESFVWVTIGGVPIPIPED